MNLLWTVKRLSSMGGAEIAYRVKQSLQARRESLGIGLAHPPEPDIQASSVWPQPLSRQFDAARYQQAAMRILAGRFDIFALEDVPLGFPPAWNMDPKTRAQAPMVFGKRLNYRDERLVGDIKYLWEPNRHLQLVTLAQAWHLSGDAQYRDGCRVLLESWFDQCPYPYGPNWTSSLEHAVRMVNWSFAWQLLGGETSAVFAGDSGRRFRSRWLDSIYQHCHFIRGHLSRFSSANNHLFGELTGLFIGASTWPFWSDSETWRSTAQQELEKEALTQTHSDGVNREQASWYHQSVADMMLFAGLAARAQSRDFSAAYWSRFESMLEFIASIMDVGGHVPQFGDSDDGVLVRFVPGRPLRTFHSLLATGAVLFSRADFKQKAERFDDKSRWLLGDAAAAQFDSLTGVARQLPVHRSFAQGGYYILGDRFESSEEIRVVADAGPLGFLSIAAHGHADALSFTLSAGGAEVLIDPGTFAYHTQKRWRDYFRGTSAHNTLRLDAQDQSVSGGNFLWTRHAHTTVVQFTPGPTEQTLLARHDGYRRLSDPVTTQRELTYDPEQRTLRVTDSLESRLSHRVEIFWHFSEDCDVELQSDQARVRNRRVILKLRWPAGLTGQVLRGADAAAVGGWRSLRYDERVPCNTLKVAGEVTGAWRGLTLIEIEFLALP